MSAPSPHAVRDGRHPGAYHPSGSLDFSFPTPANEQLVVRKAAANWNALRNMDLFGCFVKTIANKNLPSQWTIFTTTKSVENHSWEEEGRKAFFPISTEHAGQIANFAAIFKFYSFGSPNVLSLGTTYTHVILQFPCRLVSLSDRAYVTIFPMAPSSYSFLSKCTISFLCCSPVSQQASTSLWSFPSRQLRLYLIQASYTCPDLYAHFPSLSSQTLSLERHLDFACLQIPLLIKLYLQCMLLNSTASPHQNFLIHLHRSPFSFLKPLEAQAQRRLRRSSSYYESQSYGASSTIQVFFVIWFFKSSRFHLTSITNIDLYCKSASMK